MQIINKDITTIESGIIIHVCNNKGVMGAGVAKALYTKWPRVRYDYINLKTYKLGTNNYVPINKNLMVVNMIAQDGFGYNGCYLKYDALESCLVGIATTAVLSENTQIFLPYKMGCGLAGGSWEEVSMLVDMHLLEAIVCKKC